MEERHVDFLREVSKENEHKNQEHANTLKSFYEEYLFPLFYAHACVGENCCDFFDDIIGVFGYNNLTRFLEEKGYEVTWVGSHYTIRW